VHATCIAPGAIAIKLFLPLHHVRPAAIFLDEPADTIAALAGAFGALDAKHVESSFDVSEDEIESPTHDGVAVNCLSINAPRLRRTTKSSLGQRNI